MVNRRLNNLAQVDWLTIGIILLLIFMGWINIYSAEYSNIHSSVFDITQKSGKQFIWIVTALIIGLFIILIDSRFFIDFSFPLYILMLLLLLLVLFFGKEIHGSRAWFKIGMFRLQPSELTKVVTALALARFLSAENVYLRNFGDLVKAMFIIFIPAALILLQPDTGSTLVFASLIIVLYREGLPFLYVLVGILMIVLFIATLLFDKIWVVIVLVALSFIIYYLLDKRIKYFLKGIFLFLIVSGGLFAAKALFSLSSNNYVLLLTSITLTGIVLIILSFLYKLKYVFMIFVFLGGSVFFTSSTDYVFNHILEPHQQKRINLVLGIESDPLGIGYNVNQSKIAIGSGGFEGKGFLRGTQTKFSFVPEQSTDFIFCTVGEEWGFVGSTVVVLLFLGLLLRILILSERQKVRFYRIYGYGIFSILSSHFIVNIGMTIGLVPVIGIPLPFFSYGGSSLWAFTLLLFIFLKMDASRSANL